VALGLGINPLGGSGVNEDEDGDDPYDDDYDGRVGEFVPDHIVTAPWMSLVRSVAFLYTHCCRRIVPCHRRGHVVVGRWWGFLAGWIVR